MHLRVINQIIQGIYSFIIDLLYSKLSIQVLLHFLSHFQDLLIAPYSFAFFTICNAYIRPYIFVVEQKALETQLFNMDHQDK